jgi:hypothetical protein
MHRSGTSTVAAALVAAGASAKDSNATPGIDSILAALGGSWKQPPFEGLQPWALDAYRSQLRNLIEEALSDAPAGRIPVLRSPGLCLVAGQLAGVLRDDTAVVVVVRHPLEVARSLAETEGIPVAIGLALWETYNALLCEGLSSRPVHVVSYHELIDDPHRIVRLVEAAFGYDRELGQKTIGAVVKHLDADLRHHRVTSSDSESWLTIAQLRLWDQLAGAADTDQPTVLPTAHVSRAARQLLELDLTLASADPIGDTERRLLLGSAREVERSLRAELDEAIAVGEEHRLRYVTSVAERIEHADELSRGRADEIARLESRVLALSVDRTRVVQKWAAVEQALIDQASAAEQQSAKVEDLRASWQQQLADHAADVLRLHEAARQEVADHAAEVQRLHEEARQRALRVDELQVALAEAVGAHEADRSALQAANHVLIAELAAVNEHRQRLTADLLAISSSESWRLGHVLTWPVRILPGRRRARRE